MPAMGIKVWTEEHCARLTSLVAAGDSFSQIGALINAEFKTAYSRNACIGKASRMGLLSTRDPCAYRVENPKRVRPRRIYKPKTPNTEQHMIRRIRAGGNGSMHGGDAAIAPELRVLPLEPRAPGLTIIDLEPGDCRYPHGGTAAEPAITFCGHPQHTGSSYCRAHAFLCRGIGASSERAATKIGAAA
jgi:GcrA cell cycle regulator